MDKLKSFIEENREAFDLNEPSNALWGKIEEELIKTSTKPKVIPFKPKKWLSWRAAASVLVLLSMGYLTGKYWQPVTENNEIISLSPKYGSEVVQYASFISAKKKKLNAFTATNPELVSDFHKDLKSLDNHFQELKSDLPNNPNQEEILKRMIDNLQWQLELLDNQLEIIEERNKDKETEFVYEGEIPGNTTDEIPAIFV